jgi:undecaprenyl-diphosphatase
MIEVLAGWDTGLFLLISQGLRTEFLDALMPFVTNKWNFVVPVVLGATAVLLWGGKAGRVMLLGSGILLVASDQGGELLKQLFQRTRPCHVFPQVPPLVGCTGSYSFPSNHVLNLLPQAVLLAPRHRRLSWLVFALSVLVGYSRVYVGVHYPTDVLGSMVFGALFGCVALWAIRALFGEEAALAGAGRATGLLGDLGDGDRAAPAARRAWPASRVEASRAALYLLAFSVPLLLLFMADTRLMEEVRGLQTPTGLAIMNWVTLLGDGRVDFSIALVFLAVGYFLQRPREREAGKQAFYALLVSSVVAQVVKYSVCRSRPYTDNAGAFNFLPCPLRGAFASFPSGHATTAFALAAVLSATYPRARGLLYFLAMLVAASRVYLGSHFFSDILAAAILGVAVGAFFARRLPREEPAGAPAVAERAPAG